MNQISWRGFTHEVEKLSARRGLKMIRQLLGSGSVDDLARADDLARTPGVLKPTEMGSEVKDLGSGAEGLATLTADPRRGVSVRKLYDPEGIATDELIRRKDLVGRMSGGNPNLPEYYGQAQAPYGGTAQFSEYIPGPSASGSSPMGKEFANTQRSVLETSRRAGFNRPQDVRPGNTVIDQRTGQQKVIDFIPGRSDEFVNPATSTSNELQVTDSGARLFNLGSGGSTQAGALKGQLLGGRASSSAAKPAGGTAVTSFAKGTPAPATSAGSSMKSFQSSTKPGKNFGSNMTSVTNPGKGLKGLNKPKMPEL